MSAAGAGASPEVPSPTPPSGQPAPPSAVEIAPIERSSSVPVGKDKEPTPKEDERTITANYVTPGGEDSRPDHVVRITGDPEVEGATMTHMAQHMSMSVNNDHSLNKYASVPGGGKSTPVTAFNSPKDALLGCIKAGIAKSILPWWQMIVLGFNAGWFLSFGSIAGIAITAGMAAPSAVRDSSGTILQMVDGEGSMAKFLYGLIFPIGLIIIILAGSELFTGNVMYLTCAVLAGKAKKSLAAKNLFFVWTSNFIGSALCAFFLVYLTELMHGDPLRSYLTNMGLKKMSMGWGNVFLRGVGCNWLVCIALWCNLTAQDVVSKIFAAWLPVTTFVWIGWEHCVANMFVLPMALMEGVNGKNFGDALAWNLIPVTLGNILGGFLFAAGQFAIYGDYAKFKIDRLTTKHLVRHMSKEK